MRKISLEKNEEILKDDVYRFSARYNQIGLTTSSNAPSSFYSRFVPFAIGASESHGIDEGLVEVMGIDSRVLEKNGRFKEVFQKAIAKNSNNAQGYHMAGLLWGSKNILIDGKEEDVWSLIRAKNQATRSAQKCSEWLNASRSALGPRGTEIIAKKKSEMAGYLSTKKTIEDAIGENLAEKFMLDARAGYLAQAEKSNGADSLVCKMKAELITEKLGLDDYELSFLDKLKLKTTKLTSFDPEFKFYSAAYDFVCGNADKRATINAFDEIAKNPVSDFAESVINFENLPQI